MRASVEINGREFSCRVARGLFGQALGLRLRKIGSGEGFLMDLGRRIIDIESVDIDTVGMITSIDVVWISKEGRVQLVRQDVRPGQLNVSGTKARYVLEVGSGEARGIQKGDPVKIRVYH